MSKFLLQMRTDNEAFADSDEAEVRHILRKTIMKMEDRRSGVLTDHNGNTVGHFQFWDEPDDQDALDEVKDAAYDALADNPEISAEELVDAVILRTSKDALGEALHEILTPMLRGS